MSVETCKEHFVETKRAREPTAATEGPINKYAHLPAPRKTIGAWATVPDVDMTAKQPEKAATKGPDEYAHLGPPRKTVSKAVLELLANHLNEDEEDEDEDNHDGSVKRRLF